MNDAELRRGGARVRLLIGAPGGAAPVAGLLVLRAREADRAVVARVAEGRERAHRQREPTRRGRRRRRRRYRRSRVVVVVGVVFWNSEGGWF